jgi:ATP-dependent Clp protease protease subunit
MKILNRILADNRGKGLFRVENAADDEATIYLYDVIDAWFGVSAQMMVDALKSASGKTVHLHINSPGGDVFESVAMASAISAHDGDVIVSIDGVAASAATRVALAGKEVRIADSGLLMIHNSWTIAWGNAEEIRKTADLLDKVDAGIVADYTRKTGASEQQVRDWMAAETWFNAQEALDNKFVDAIDSTTQAAANKWDLSAYQNAPKQPERPAEAVAAQIANRERKLRLLSLT